MASGEAELGDTRFTAIPNYGNDANIQPRNAGAGTNNNHDVHIAQTFAALMTAGYMKEQVNNHYYQNSSGSALIYTVI